MLSMHTNVCLKSGYTGFKWGSPSWCYCIAFSDHITYHHHKLNNPHKSLWHHHHHHHIFWQIGQCAYSRSPDAQSGDSSLHKHRSVSSNVPCSAHLYLHTKSPADGTHLEINDSRGPTGPAGDLGTSAKTPATHLTDQTHTASEAWSYTALNQQLFLFK